MTPDEANSRARFISSKIVLNMRHLGYIRPDADTVALADVGVLLISSAIQAAYEDGAELHEKEGARKRAQKRKAAGK